MTTPFENFVNIALGKSVSADVTLPTADDIPVFTGIGRQVTGKTKAELGLATSSQLTDKADLVDGLVPANQLPGYVDDVLEYANLASFPLLGEASKLYIAIDTNLVYRWGGSTYAVTSSSLALGENSSTAYRGDRGKTAYDHSQATGNPHGTTATNLGLGNVNNTSDADKPISTATQTALNGKEPTLANVITANTYGSATQYPVITFNAKGIATGVTLQTVVSPAVFSDSAFRIQDNDNATKQLAFEVSGIATGTTCTITMPNANLDLGTVTSSSIQTGAFVYATGMGSVVKTITGSGVTFDIDELATNKAHSVTIRSNADNSYPFDTTTTFSFVSTKSFGAGIGFCDEGGVGLFGSCTSGSPFVVTLAPNESWEVRYMGESGFVSYFSVKKNFAPILLTSSVKFRNSLSTALGFTLSGTATVTDKVLTLPDKDINLGNLSSVATTDSNTLSGTRTRILGGSSNTVSGTDNVAINCYATTLGGSATKVTAINCTTVNVTRTLTKAFLAGCSDIVLSPDAPTNDGLVALGVAYKRDLFSEFPQWAGHTIIGTEDGIHACITVYGNNSAAGNVNLTSSTGVKPLAAIGGLTYTKGVQHIIHLIGQNSADTPNKIVTVAYKVIAYSDGGGIALGAVQTIESLFNAVGTPATPTVTISITAYDRLNINVASADAMYWAARVDSYFA